MSFAADIGQGLVWVGRGVLLSAFGVDEAGVDVVLEPRKVFVVVSYHYVHGRLRILGGSRVHGGLGVHGRLSVHGGLGVGIDLES